jgi:PAS domain S-box-containing protein
VITPVWAPAGIALAAVVLFGPRAWPAIALGAFLANATSDASIPVAAAIATGNTLEALAGGYLLRRVDFRPAMARLRDVFALVFLGAAAAATIAATNGVTTLWLAEDLNHSYGSSWLLWWIGDAMGVLVVAPLLLVWITAPPRLSRARLIEGGVLLAVLGTLASAVFIAGGWRYRSLLFPVLVWAPFRFRQAGATAASFVVVAFGVAGAVHGSVPLGQESATHTVQVMEALFAVVTVTMLLLGAMLAEREAAEEGLVAARDALAEAQHVAHIGSWEWNIADDRITWSDELYRLFGLEPGIPLTYEEYVAQLHPADTARVRETVDRAYAEGGTFAFEHRAVQPDGSVRWLYGRGRAVRDDSGAVVRMLGTAQDITERRRIDELRDTILATVSHELRTPLTAITGFALTLKERGDDLTPELRADIIETLTAEARRLESLLADLLDLDRLRLGLLEPSFRDTDVGELVSRVAAGYSKNGALDVRTERVVAAVDPPKVERMVENLLVNAFKHTPPGTAVNLRVEGAGDDVLVAVDDRGPGVPPGERESVFEIFSRGDGTTAPGTGVGLSLVARFAELHGGRAWVEDNPGGGASFRVSLPRTHSSSALS